VAVGSKAGRFANGVQNTFMGFQAGQGISEGARNVVVGAEAAAVHDAQNSTFIGYRARVENPVGYITGATAIGENAVVSKSNTIILGQPNIQVGIGTSLPTYKLHLNGGLNENLMNLSSNGAVKMTVSSKGRVHVTDSVTIDGRMRIGTINAGSRRLAVDGNVYFDDILEVGNSVLIGTNTAATGHKLTVDGKIACEEVRVQDSGDWPDYVFDSAYDLKPLQDVHQFIQREKHLPGIPSAAEISADGIEIGDMQKRLLEKIEELTLHMISMEAELRELKSSK
jgi:hypothetical protein